MIELTSCDEFNLKGMGRIFTIKLSEIPKDAKIYMGDQIKLNGREARVTGIGYPSQKLHVHELGELKVKFLDEDQNQEICDE